MTKPPITEEEKINVGLCCAACKVEYDTPHGKPVLCYRCHNGQPGTPAIHRFPKAWLEEKPL